MLVSTGVNAQFVQIRPTWRQSRLMRQQDAHRPRNLEFKSTITFRDDLLSRCRSVRHERIPLVTPILDRRAGQRMARGVRDRAGAFEFVGAVVRAHVGCFLNHRARQHLGIRVDAQEHRGGGNQEDSPGRIHVM